MKEILTYTTGMNLEDTTPSEMNKAVTKKTKHHMIPLL